MKRKLNQLKLILLCTSLSLASGCKKSECDLVEDHVHLYEKNGYVKYMQNEKLSDWGYKWNEDYYYLNRKDIEIQEFLDKKRLLVIDLNVDKIKEVQEEREDYVEYEYEYEDTETIRSYDHKLDDYVSEKIKVTKYDWTTNENHFDLTGKRRLCHPVYQACKIEKNNKGKYTLIKSDYVDDVLAIKEEYPYITDGYCKIQYIDLPREYVRWRR